MSKSIWKLPAEAAKYAQARPSHPKDLVKVAKAYLREGYSGEMYQAVDVGCGTGLSTKNLVGEFQHVIGLDTSSAMIDQAMKQGLPGSVVFKVSGAEKLPISDGSTQLVIAGRAIHYFNLDKFYKEVDRVLVDNGILCYYSVVYPNVSSEHEKFGGEVNAIFWRYLKERLADYWPLNKETGNLLHWNRREIYFTKIPPPFAASARDESVSTSRPTTIQALARELDTYSSSVCYREQLGDAAGDQLLDEFVEECQAAAARLAVDPQQTPLTATDNFFMVMSRKS